ncbi:hypothetical protein G7046_g5868 [Stylonectria norvegica]|nr:hypothetical protein G7046_g5868 [Stylonectria norvegica]
MVFGRVRPVSPADNAQLSYQSMNARAKEKYDNTYHETAVGRRLKTSPASASNANNDNGSILALGNSITLAHLLRARWTRPDMHLSIAARPCIGLGQLLVIGHFPAVHLQCDALIRHHPVSEPSTRFQDVAASGPQLIGYRAPMNVPRLRFRHEIRPRLLSRFYGLLNSSSALWLLGIRAWFLAIFVVQPRGTGELAAPKLSIADRLGATGLQAASWPVRGLMSAIEASVVSLSELRAESENNMVLLDQQSAWLCHVHTPSHYLPKADIVMPRLTLGATPTFCGNSPKTETRSRPTLVSRAAPVQCPTQTVGSRMMGLAKLRCRRQLGSVGGCEIDRLSPAHNQAIPRRY